MWLSPDKVNNALSLVKESIELTPSCVALHRWRSVWKFASTDEGVNPDVYVPFFLLSLTSMQCDLWYRRRDDV